MMSELASWKIRLATVFNPDVTIHGKTGISTNIWHENDCPICHRRCKCYDRKNPQPRSWRALDWGATLVEVVYDTHRIDCPEHGILVADVPWAYPGSGFTKDFDLTVGWLAAYLPRSVVSKYMRIDWETVVRSSRRYDSRPFCV